MALARALAREPAVLLLDEPFAAVDRTVRRRLQDEIDELRRTLDIPLVLVTHDFDDVVRLATRLLILERGKAIASGALSDLTSRPDMPWLREAVGLGSVFDARVVRRDPERGLLELTFGGGTLIASNRVLDAGTVVRVRIAARDVILATSEPDGLSLHNVLPGTVTALNADPAFDHIVVQIAVGEVLLLAEVTRDAIARLDLTSGKRLYALIKSVSIGVIPDFRSNLNQTALFLAWDARRARVASSGAPRADAEKTRLRLRRVFISCADRAASRARRRHHRCPSGGAFRCQAGVRGHQRTEGAIKYGESELCSTRIARQNQNFAASCTTLGSRAVVIVPKLAGPSCAAGAPKFAVFSRLNTSKRSSIARSPPNLTLRITARSTSWYVGPRTGLREADPIVN